ncbi:hypothetical protein [Desulforhopalus sp. 52FAK]
MDFTTQQILEQYVLGKDKDQYVVLEAIFADFAEVEFEIRSEKISFPKTVKGNKDIARVLSKDFNKSYERVRTYYLEGVEQNANSIDNQPWLVVMKEVGNDVTRVGTGYYNWILRKTENGLKVTKLKIYIHEMLELDDSKSVMLEDIQRSIDYPWPAFLSVTNTLKPYGKLCVVSKYIHKHSR